MKKYILCLLCFLFSTLGLWAQLAAPSLVSPQNDGYDLFIRLKFSWMPVENAEHYQLQVSLSPQFYTILRNITGIADTSFIPEDLYQYNYYFWRVRASNSTDTSQWSSVWTFETGFVSYAYGYNVNDPTGTYPEGPIMFALQDPTWITPLEDQTGQNYLTAGVCIWDEWYTSEANTNNLVTVNPGWGERTIVGNMGVDINGMAFDYESGLMYGVNWESGANLYTIDLDYGTTTLVGPLSNPNAYIISLAYNWDYTNLFGIDIINDVLVSIDVNTAEVTTIGSLGFDAANVAQDFEINEDDDIAYLTSFSTQGEFRTIDLSTGSSTLISNFPGGMHVTGFAIPMFSMTDPEIPELVYPGNNTINIPVSPTFDWNQAWDAIFYILQISLDHNFLNMVYNISGIFGTSFVLPAPLNPSTEYYWRVKSFTGMDFGQSYKWKFTTAGPVAQPILITPDNASNIPTTVQFRWFPSAGALNWDFQVATDSNFTNLVINDTALTVTTIIPPEFQIATKYYWRVRGYNPYEQGTWSAIWNFTTSSNVIAIGTSLLYNSQYSYPAPYGQFNVGAKHQILILADELINAGATAGNFTSLSFNVAAPNVGPHNNFTIKMKQTTVSNLNNWDLTGWTEVYTTSAYIPHIGWNLHNFNVPFTWDGVSNIKVDICFNNFPSTNRTYNASTYYTTTTNNSVIWIVGYDDNNLCTNPGALTSSKNRPNMMFSISSGLPTPTLIAPALNATGVSVTPTFEWNPVTNADFYTIQVSGSSDFTNLIVNTTLLTTNFSLTTPLSYSTTYYWHVNATDSTLTYDWSNVWNFTTLDNGITAPSLIAPSNNATGVLRTPIFEWNPVTGAVNYTLQVSSTTDFTNLLVNTTLLTTVYSIIEPPLTYNTTYYWRVNSSDSTLTSVWSNVWSFTTVQPPPVPWIIENPITGNSAIIIIPLSINPTIGSRIFVTGDAVGLFYTRDGEYICGGYSVWNDQSLGMGIAVWGDDEMTTIKDGFSTYEIYTFKIWDCLAQVEYYAIATPASGPMNYQPDAVTTLTSLYTSEVLIPTLNLNSGWNMISSYVYPANSLLEVLFAPIANNIKIMKNSSGQFWVPGFVNTIIDWNYKEGYQIYMNFPASIGISGTIVVPENTQISLPQGWNIISYLRNSSMSIVTALASITNNIMIVKNNFGGMYIPNLNINTIGNMLPGQGYQIYLSGGCVLTYPGN